MKLVLVLLLTAFATHCLGAVSAMVDKTDVDELQVVMLNVAVSGDQVYDQPDWTVLNDDFLLAGSSQQRESIEINNGRVKRSISWTVYLIPKRTGSLTIPSFRFGNEETDEISITVRELDPDIKKQVNESVFFETEIEPQDAYVQAAIHVTRRLYYSNDVHVRPEHFEPLRIDDALVVEIGDVKRSFSVRGDDHLNLLIRRSVVFPERSGELTIPTTQIMVRVSLGARDITLPISSEPKTIRILPIPREYPADQSWFPASGVRVHDSLASSDLKDFNVGDSIVRQLEITAIDTHSTGIPQIQLNTPDSIRRYPESPKLSDSALIDSVVGKRVQTETLLLTQPGSVEIPQTEIVWWDPANKQVMRTIVEKQVFEVASGVVEGSLEEQSIEFGVPTDSSRQNELSSGPGFLFPLWQVSIVLATFVGLAALLAYKLLVKRMVGANTVPFKHHVIFLSKRLNSKDPSEVKRAMADWLVAHLQISQIEAFQILRANPATEKILDRLNESIYTNSPFTNQVRSKELKRDLNLLVINQEHKVSSSQSFLTIYEHMGMESSPTT